MCVNIRLIISYTYNHTNTLLPTHYSEVITARASNLPQNGSHNTKTIIHDTKARYFPRTAWQGASCMGRGRLLPGYLGVSSEGRSPSLAGVPSTRGLDLEARKGPVATEHPSHIFRTL